MVQSTKTFRVFVSSTFNDLKEERNKLQKDVFPKLRKLCMDQGFRFQAIDLRWGISEEAQSNQQTMKICLEEIKRSQEVSPKPNFIVLLGNRYGWKPLPYEIPATEFEAILNLVSEVERKFLLWDEELEDGGCGWYRLDENAVPSVYVLQHRDIKFEDYESWSELDQKTWKENSWPKIADYLHSILLKATSRLDLSEEDFTKYYASATEQEIVKGVLKVEDADEHVFAFFREINDAEEIIYDKYSKAFFDYNKNETLDKYSKEKLEELKGKIKYKLPSSNIFDYDVQWKGNNISTSHLDNLCNDVYVSLQKIIQTQIGKYKYKDDLDFEIEAHKKFGNDRSKFFIGRNKNLEKISGYLKSSFDPFVLYGISGSGKSALMAQAVKKLNPSFYDDEELYDNGIIVRFIGATPESSDFRSLLESIYRQIARIYGKNDSNIPSEYDELVNDFKERLNFATREKPLFIFLDALDQLSNSENAHNLTWIPDELPENIHIVLSTLKEPFESYIKNRIPEENSNEVSKLEEGKILLDSWLKDAGRKLTKEQEDEILNKFHNNGMPLYLKLVYEEAIKWKSYTQIPNLAPDIRGIILHLFNGLSSPENHGILFSHSLGYLSAAKNGLTEDEILEVLAIDEDVSNLTKKFHKPPENRLPVALWSRLYFDLEPYLTWRRADGTSLLSFYHKQLEEVAKDEFLKNVELRSHYILDEKNHYLAQWHHILAKYFQDQDLLTDKNGKNVYNLRKLSELPYQEAYAELLDELEKTLTNYRFIEAKCDLGRVYDLIEDYNYTPLKNLNLIKNALQLSASVIIKDIDQLPGQLIGRLLNQNALIIQNFLQNINKNVRKYWLCPNFTSLNPADSNIINLWDAYNDPPVCRLLVSKNGKKVAVIKGNKVDYWDLSTGESINEIEGKNHFSKSDLLNFSQNLPYTHFNEEDRIGKWEYATKNNKMTVKCELSHDTNPLRTNPVYNYNVTLSKDGTKTNLDSGLAGITYYNYGFTSVAISSDNKYVLAGGLNGCIKLWRVDDGKEIINDIIFSETIIALAFIDYTFIDDTNYNNKIVFLSASGKMGVSSLRKIKNKSLNLEKFHCNPSCLYINKGDFAIIGCKNGNIIKIDTLNGNTLKKWARYTLWKGINFRVTSDFEYALKMGVGPDHYDGWTIEICDIINNKSIFGAETNIKDYFWRDIEYVKEDGVPFIFGVEKRSDGNSKKHLINLETGIDNERSPSSDALVIPWLEPQQSLDNGILTYSFNKDLFIKIANKNLNYQIIEQNKSFKVILPNGENLFYSPDDPISHVAISSDNSCIALACQSGQLHCLSIYDPYGNKLKFSESDIETGYVDTSIENEKINKKENSDKSKILTDNEECNRISGEKRSSYDDFKDKIEKDRSNIAIKYQEAISNGLEPSGPEGTWFASCGTTYGFSGGYAIYCRRCGSIDQDEGRPPEKCPRCGWNGKANIKEKKSRWKFW